jgi:hypothetical protein
MQKHRGLFLMAVTVILAALDASAQVDPDKRELVQVGFSQAIQGASPVAAYGYYYLNEPNFYKTNLTLRVAIAPVYLDSEVGLVGALGPNTDLGIGLAGGAFADNYYEFEDGKYLPEQSFTGDSGETSLSVYHLFDPGKLIPLYGILRVKEHFSAYERNDDTAGNFVLPHDHSTTEWRVGLRFGGREPLLHPELAMELSAWYEGQYRTDSGSYGFNGDRIMEANSELYWARALLIYTMPKSKQSLDVELLGGGSWHADRFSAYRLGGDLPLASEFPLTIPGYFYQELSAKNFVSFSAQYTIPLDANHSWNLSPMGAIAAMEYIPGLSQPGAVNSGVGLGLGYRSHSGVWQIMGDYGYGFEAQRAEGRGAQSIGILCQLNLGAKNPGGETRLDRFIGFIPSRIFP